MWRKIKRGNTTFLAVFARETAALVQDEPPIFSVSAAHCCVHPERGHADPITRADILNVCTCGPWCCLQPLSCLAGPQKPSGTFFFFSLLPPPPLLPLALHHYRPHAFPETSWAKQLDVLDGYHMFPLRREAAGEKDILKRVKQGVRGCGYFLCASSQ